MRVSTSHRLLVCGALALFALMVSASGAAAAPPTRGADTDARYALRVLRYVPESYRGTCQALAPTDHFSGVAAQAGAIRGSVECFPEPGLAVTFTQFSSAAAMDAAYDSYLISDNFGEFAAGVDCGGDGTYDVGGETVGRWACYTQDPTTTGGVSGVQTNWTDTRTSILATAVRRDADAAALAEWWNGSDAGPLSRPTDAGIPAPLSAAEQRRVGRRLLRVVPEDLRESCAPGDVNHLDDIGAEVFGSRVFIRAMLRCEPTDGADAAFYFAFADGWVARQYTEKVENTVDLSGGASDCPASGTYRAGKKRDAGAYVCWFHPDGAAIVWSNDSLAVVGDAIDYDGDADSLLEWWRQSGGPIT
jgi:hypothetical protein